MSEDESQNPKAPDAPQDSQPPAPQQPAAPTPSPPAPTGERISETKPQTPDPTNAADVSDSLTSAPELPPPSAADVGNNQTSAAPPGINLPLYATALSMLAGLGILVYLLKPASVSVDVPLESAQPPAPVPSAVSSALPDAPEAPLTFQSLSAHLRAAMEATRSSKVVYEDVLGEGAGNWDADPRYPEGTVNCIVWITQVIAEGYLPRGTTEERTQLLDQLRYYNHTVSFGTRKHFLAHQLAVEPEPFVPFFDGACAADSKDHVRLDFAKFKRSHRYGCPLHREGMSDLRYPFISGKRFVECAPRLEPGVYVLFGVATEKYHRVYGKESGPLGLVHGMFLDVRSPQEVKVWHASTATKQVREEDLGAYVKRMTESMHKGYALYRLDPTWNWKSYAPSEWKSAPKCEERLSKR